MVAGGLEPTPADTGRGRGSSCTSHQFIMGLTYRDKQPFALTFAPTHSLESPVDLHVFGLWETRGEHAHSAEKSPTPAGYRTQDRPDIR